MYIKRNKRKVSQIFLKVHKFIYDKQINELHTYTYIDRYIGLNKNENI